MDGIKEYLLSVTAAALICGMFTSLAGKNSSISKLLKLLCGLFLAATVIKPALDVRIDNIYAITDSLTQEGDAAVAAGEKMAAQEMKRIIKEKTETYILDKAKSLRAEISVQVELEEYTPIRVTVMGDIAPFARSELSACIAQELGIPSEEQIWKRS